MSLESGARTIVEQCLAVSRDENVVVVNDGNDQELIDALLDVVEQRVEDYDCLEYEEPRNHGEEPPERVAEALKDSDVFIAPTKKSISHTKARVNACENGARGATLPGITKEIWKSSLKADYRRVKQISEQVYGMLAETDRVRIKTPSGTDLEFEVNLDYFHTDTGFIHDPGEFGNLPAGEADGGVVNASGVLVIDHMPFVPETDHGARIEIQDSEVVAVREAGQDSELVEAFDSIPGARNVAEFGFGTNPEAKLIGNILQDKKALGTVHIAFGDNSSYMPESDPRRVESDIHWDTVCKDPAVWFDDRKVLDSGDPTFL